MDEIAPKIINIGVRTIGNERTNKTVYMNEILNKL